MASESPYGLLYRGKVRLSADGRAVEVVDGTLEPIADTIVFSMDPTVARKYRLAAWRTDGKGSLRLVEPSTGQGRFVPRVDNDRQIFHLPPMEALTLARSIYGKDWARVLSRAFLGEEKFKERDQLLPIELAKLPFVKESLRPPDEQSSEMVRRFYDRQPTRKWYERNPRFKPLRAFVLYKIRGIVCVFSKNDLPVDEIEIWYTHPEKSRRFLVRKDSIKTIAGTLCAGVVAPPDLLEEGIYHFRVTLGSAPSSQWTRTVCKQGSYCLADKVHFHMKNIAGEYDVVNLDPISLEEAVLTQFPDRYEHLIRASRSKSVEGVQSPEPSSELQRFLSDWSNRIQWSAEKVKLSTQLVNAGGGRKRAAILGQALNAAIDPKDKTLELAKSTVELAFAAKESVDTWERIVRSFRADKDLAKAKAFLLDDVSDQLERNRWWRHLRKQYIDKSNVQVLRIKDMNDKELRAFLGRSGAPSQSDLERVFGRKGAKAVLFAYDALRYVDTVLAVDEAASLAGEGKEIQYHLSRLFQRYQDHLADDAKAPMREGMVTLEKHRTATVLAEMKASGAELNAYLTALDALLGTMCLIPHVAGVARIIFALKTTVVVLKDALTTLGGWLDELLLGNYFGDVADREDLRQQVFDAAETNRKLLWAAAKENRAAGDLEIQHRLRAEALYGLMQLLIRASISDDCIGQTEAETAQKYLAKLEAYKVGEYVQRFLLNDQWAVATWERCPISMYACWLWECRYGSQGRQREGENEEQVLGELLLANVGVLMMEHSLDPSHVETGSVVADFQKRFPIHCVPRSLDSFASMFKPSFSEVERDWIKHTCIYRRAKDSTDEKDWELVNPAGKDDAEDLKALSPLDQIRVLVVLDAQKATSGIYPARLVLHRTDGLLNIEGPEYEETVTRLGPQLLESEARWLGHLGCVIYPCYTFFGRTVMGIKPMAKKLGASLGRYTYYRLGGLTDMRYGFWLEVGGKKSGQWVTTGAEQGRESSLNELRVSLDCEKTPVLRHMLNYDFLTSWSREIEYPSLFHDSEYSRGVGPCYVRVGGAGSYRLPSEQEYGDIKFEDFDWRSPVELILIVWAKQVYTAHYEGTIHDWRSLPISMQLINYAGSDVHGPTYQGTMRYLGDFRLADKMFFQKNEPGEKLKPVVDMLASDPQHREDFDHNLAPRAWYSGLEREGIRGGFRIFGAYFCMRYYDFVGEEVKSVRPFADELIEYPGYYRYGVVNVKAPENIGLDVEKVLAGPRESDAIDTRPEYEFHFQAPRSYTSGVAWTNGLSGKTDHVKKRVEDWITRAPTAKRAKEML